MTPSTCQPYGLTGPEKPPARNVRKTPAGLGVVFHHLPWTYLGVNPKIMVPTKHPFVHRVFQYFHHPFWMGFPLFLVQHPFINHLGGWWDAMGSTWTSILGYQYFWKHPVLSYMTLTISFQLLASSKKLLGCPAGSDRFTIVIGSWFISPNFYGT